MEQTARFISRPRRIEELRDFGIGVLRPYQIVSTVCLGGVDYENFVTDLLADRAFLENVPGCGQEGPLVCCLCVTCRGRDSVLVLPDSTGHVALAALLLS
jgi:hypothetical protein